MTRGPVRPGATSRPRHTHGLSLLELLITVALIASLVGAAALNYFQVVEEQKLGKAANECKQFVKGLKTYESRKGTAIKTLMPSRGQLVKFTLEELRIEAIMPSIPDDPWSSPYEVDTTKGIVFSVGPDGKAFTPDDIVAHFRAGFEVRTAQYDRESHSVWVDFTGAVDRSTVMTANMDLVGVPAGSITTLNVDLLDPYRVKLRLSRTLTLNKYKVRITPGIRSVDGAVLTSASTLET